MSARGQGQPSYGSRSTQAPGMMRHGSYPVSHTLEPPSHLDRGDSKRVVQSTELERLASDNQRLAATHVALRQDLVATQQDIKKLKAHIGSIHTESDIQIRILLDKISKKAVKIQAGENVKKDLQRAHTEARSLVATRQELIGQVEKANQELEKVHAQVEKLPKMHVELDGLKQEHQKLRSTFEHEKSLNLEKVAQMELMERDLVGMAREVERLRAEISNAEKRANAPNAYATPYMNHDVYPPHHMQASAGSYVDGYGNHHLVQMGVGGAPDVMIPYGGSHHPQWGPPYSGSHPGHVPGGNPQWGVPPPY